MKIGVMGVGVMGQSILDSLLKKAIAAPSDLLAFDARPEALQAAAAKYGIPAAESPEALCREAEIVLFCVKPQNAAAMMEPLNGHFREGQVIVSIMAGVSMETIRRTTGHAAIVRAMPNIPARIGDGMTVWAASPAVSDAACMIAKMIFQAFGLETRVETEDLLDAATAVSGSGPAYIFYMAENLVKAAAELGFDATTAHRLVQQTFRGAMNLWYETGDEPENLRRSVTSKGGTTAAALKVFRERETPALFSDAIRAAYVRAQQLREVADGRSDPASHLDSEG